MSTSKSIVTPTPVSRKYVVLMVCASLALVHLIGLMCALNEMTHNMYATQGKEMHYESFFVPLMTLTPLPLILAMISIIVFAVKKNMQWILNLLIKIFFIQTLVFISIPVLLAALERELNAAVLIPSGLCISSQRLSLFLFLYCSKKYTLIIIHTYLKPKKKLPKIYSASRKYK